MIARELERLKQDVEGYVANITSGIGRSGRKSIEPLAQRHSAIDRPEKDYVQAFRQFVNHIIENPSLIRSRCAVAAASPPPKGCQDREPSRHEIPG